MIAQYISVDEQKRLLPGYLPERAEEFHEASARIADKVFMRALRDDQSETVILLCGGSASGKTEFYSEYLIEEDAIVFDSTLPTILGARNKLRMIEKARKRAVICAVLPDDLHRAFAAFLGRDRLLQPEHFYRTHSGSREVLLWIATNKVEVEIRILESSYAMDGKLRYRSLEYGDAKGLVEFLQGIQYTEQQIAHIVHPL